MKDEKNRKISDFFSALSHPTRIEIVTELLRGEKCVNDMQKLTMLRQPNISQHLFLLRSHKIVTWHQRGNRKCYCLINPQLIRSVLSALKKHNVADDGKKR